MPLNLFSEIKTETMETDFFKTNFKKKLFFRKNYDLFGSDIHEDLHWGKIFVHLFGEYYSRYRIRQSVDNEGLLNALIKEYSIKESQILRIDRAKEGLSFQINYERTEVLLILKECLCFGLYDDCIDIIYSSKISIGERNNIINLVDTYKVETNVKRKFHMVQYSRNSFDLADFDLKQCDINIDKHYNEDFQEINNLIIKSLEDKNKNGIILLHGKYGSGKTYYLRHLISKIQRKFIYFPLKMVDAINSPEFLPFISEHPNSVLILEDCESILVPRENGQSNSSSLSNLLNLGDGLLSDALNVNVICTFNASVKKIDDAILRKGRLLARYDFKELEISKAQALANELGKNVIIERPMTLSDIYNLETMDFENKPAKSIGFKAA